MKTTSINLIGALGHPLAAQLDEPEHGARAVAIFAHCFTCSKDLPVVRRIARTLTQQGFAVLRFDFTGVGQSAGDFAQSNFSSNIEDLVCAADWLAENYQAPALLVGHSLGGTAVLAAAARIKSVKAVATLGAPSEPAHITKMFTAVSAEIERNGKADVQIGSREFEISQQFIENAESYSLLSQLSSLHCALLIFHSPIDTVVGIHHAAAIFKAAKHPKSFMALDRADHMLSNKADAEFVAQILGQWATRHL
ncbi:alpha/beta hydrolase family protein [Ferrigenium sp. UT5]|uniref:alpha/beta hydrolase family protein n=1 Tax=Ferrigenium sp. UT5 TaxID=3242105 RepID=UPI00354D32DD